MDYEQFKIKIYNSWDLYLHASQFPYVGRCYAWAKRENSKKVLDMTKEDRDELFDVVIPQWENAVNVNFSPDWTNISSLGNTTPHLHWHLIPRYHSPREVKGIQFVDPNPIGNYAPYPKMEISLDILLEIKQLIREKL